MEHGVIPPTINLENPDVEAGCDLDYVPNVAFSVPKDKPLEVIISDNLGFGTCIRQFSCGSYVLSLHRWSQRRSGFPKIREVVV
jgi:hypothetical protein